jgi:hypothetical protein
MRLSTLSRSSSRATRHSGRSGERIGASMEGEGIEGDEDEEDIGVEEEGDLRR